MFGRQFNMKQLAYRSIPEPWKLLEGDKHFLITQQQPKAVW